MTVWWDLATYRKAHPYIQKRIHVPLWFTANVNSMLITLFAKLKAPVLLKIHRLLYTMLFCTRVVEIS